MCVMRFVVGQVSEQGRGRRRGGRMERKHIHQSTGKRNKKCTARKPKASLLYRHLSFPFALRLSCFAGGERLDTASRSAGWGGWKCQFHYQNTTTRHPKDLQPCILPLNTIKLVLIMVSGRRRPYMWRTRGPKGEQRLLRNNAMPKSVLLACLHTTTTHHNETLTTHPTHPHANLPQN